MKGQKETYQTGTLELTFCRSGHTEGRRWASGTGLWSVGDLPGCSVVMCVQAPAPLVRASFCSEIPSILGTSVPGSLTRVMDSLADLLHCPPKLLRPAGCP